MKPQFLKISLGIFFLVVAIPLIAQDYGTEIKNLLPEGKIEFEVLDSVEATVRQVELTEKFQRAYRENMSAFNSYFEKKGNNQTAKYPKNKILSEKEFIELMDFANNMKVVPSQTKAVEIIYSDDNSISFKSDGKLSILNLITYNIETNTFTFKNYTLNFKNSVNVETNTNAFQEAWKGYNWDFSEPGEEEMEKIFSLMKKNLINFDRLSIKGYKITLGKLMNSGKTFMIIKLKDLQEGEWIYNVETPIRMK